MQKFFMVAVPLLALVLSAVVADPAVLQAHPGRTAADGCHYCRTDCDQWGIPANERHCHGGSAPVQSSSVRSAPAKPVAPAGTLGQAAEATTAYAVVEVVDGFYEWQKAEKGKQPFYIRRRDKQPFAFAGLYERWHDKAHDETIDTFTIITTEPNSLMRRSTTACR